MNKVKKLQTTQATTTHTHGIRLFEIPLNERAFQNQPKCLSWCVYPCILVCVVFRFIGNVHTKFLLLQFVLRLFDAVVTENVYVTTVKQQNDVLRPKHTKNSNTNYYKSTCMWEKNREKMCIYEIFTKPQ